MSNATDIAQLGLGNEQLRKDVTEAVALFDKVFAAIDRLENTKAKPGSLTDLMAKNKQLVETNNQLIDSYNKLTTAQNNSTKATTDVSNAVKTTVAATNESSKSFTQNSAEVEKNVQKQKELKKELDGITASRKQLTEIAGKVNFDGNETAKVQFEKELVDLSQRELAIKKEIAGLNTSLTNVDRTTKGDNTGGQDIGNAAKQKAIEKEQVSQLNAELKSQAQLELANAGSISEAKAAVSLLTKERDKLNLTTDEGVTRQTALNKKIDEYNAFIKENNDLLGKQRLNVGNYPSAFAGALETLKSELTSVKNQLNDPGLSGKQLESLQNQEKLLTQLTENLNEQFNSSRQELRAYQEAAKQLGLSLGDDSKLFNEFAAQVGTAKDEISDLQARVNFNASDTKYLDGAIQAVNGLAGAYSAATGVQALFGDESQDVQKIMVKLQALIAITTGLQQLQNAVQSESAAMQSILAAKTGLLTIAKKLLGAATAQSAAATQAEAVAQTEAAVASEATAGANTQVAATAEAATAALAEETVATEAATVATTTLAEAFAATGIGAVIIAIVAAIGLAAKAIYDYATAGQKAYDINLQINTSLKEQADLLAKQKQILDEGFKGRIQNQQKENDLQAAAGETTLQRIENEGKLLAKQKEAVDANYALQLAEAEKEYADAGLKGAEALTASQTAALVKYKGYVSQVQFYQKQLTDAQNASVNELPDGASFNEQTEFAKRKLISQKLIEEAQGRIKDLQPQADAYKSFYDEITKTIDENTQNQIAIKKNQTEQSKYNADEERKLTLALTEFEVSNIKSRNEQILNNARSSFDARRKAIESNLAAEIKLAKAQQNDVSTDPSSSQNDILIAQKQFEEKTIELLRDEHTKKRQLNDEEDKRDLAADKAMYDLRLKASLDFYNAASKNPNLSFQQQTSAFEKTQQLQREQIDANYKNLKAERDYTFKTNSEKEADEANYQQQISDLVTKGNSDRLTLIKNYNEKAQQEAIAAQNAVKNAIQGTYQRDIDNVTDYQNGVEALNKSLEQKEISFKDYNKRLKTLVDDFNNYELTSQLAKDRATLAEGKLSGAEEYNLRKKIADEEKELIQKVADEEIEASKELADAEKQLAQDVVDFIQTVGDAGYQKKIDNYQRLKNASDEYYSKEIENIQKAHDIGALTDQQAADQSTLLQAEQAARDQQYGEKSRQLKIKQARFDRSVQAGAALAQGIQTEVSLIGKVAEAKAQAALLAANPLTIAYAPIAAAAAVVIGIQEILVGAATALNVAKILSAPLPSYKNGLWENKPAHWALFGEAGPEIVEQPGLPTFIATAPTIDCLTANARITPISYDEVNRAMNKGLMQQTAQMLGQGGDDRKRKQAEEEAQRANAYNTNRIVGELKKNRPYKPTDYNKLAERIAWEVWRRGATNWNKNHK